MSIRVQHIRGTTAEVEGVTPLAGELGYDTTRKEAHLGDGATAGGMRLSKKNVVEIVSPAQITADQNDYNPTSLKHAGALNITSDAARNVTGLVPNTVTDTTDGVTRQIYNAGAFNITLKDQNAASTAANRFDLNGADVVLLPKTSVTLRYSNSAARWIVVGTTVGQSVASAAVVARTLAGSALGFSMINGTIVESRAAGAATFAIKTLAGTDPSVSDPVLVLIRDAALATGGYSMMTLTAATSLVVSSGSSLGTTNAAAFKLWLVGFNDAGTFRLGVINALTGVNALNLLTPDALASSTAEGGAGNADNAQTFYTGVAVGTKSYAVLGYADYPAGLAAAGTWSAAPTTLQLYQAAIALPGRAPETWIRQSGLTLRNGTLVASVAGSALTVAIKTLAGNDPSAADPVYVLVRNATAATGDFTVMTLTAATSIVVPSTATLGSVNATAFKLWLVGFNDAGTFRLGVINCLSGTSIYPLGQFPIASSTLTPASAAQVFYTTGAGVASKAYAVLGYLTWETGLAAAGTWSAGPTRAQLYGHGVPLPGTEIQRQRNVISTVLSGATLIPFDNTTPQNTEGDQAFSQAITPSSAAHLLEIRANMNLNLSAAVSIGFALFQDAIANALASGFSGVNGAQSAQLEHHMLAGTTSATTLKLRVGPSSAATWVLNGTVAAANLFNATFASFFQVKEIAT